jgi:hypothetical protein
MFFLCMPDVPAMMPGCVDPYRPRLQFGFGSGLYFNHDMNDGEASSGGYAFSFTSDYNLNRQWELSLQQQIGTWRRQGYEQGLKDIDISVFAIRSFFRSDNLKFGMGLGYGVREMIEAERVYFDGSPSPRYVSIIKSRSSMTIATRLELRIFRYRSVSLNLAGGVVLAELGQIGLSGHYIMPSIKIGL